MSLKPFVAFILVLGAAPAMAAPSDFKRGPVITQHGGAIAKIDADVPTDTTVEYKVVYNVDTSAPGKLNRKIDSAARMMNMLASNGVPLNRIKPVLVVHGGGLLDILTDANYKSEFSTDNPNGGLVRELMAKGVPVYVCGQSAALTDAKKSDLLPGVKFATSAMEMFAVLDRQGYTIMP